MLPRFNCLVLPALFFLLTALCVWLSNNRGSLSMTADYPADHLPATHPEVLEALRTTYLLPPSTHPYNLSWDPAYLATSHQHTWTFIHHYLTRMFEGERGGFFVEAGALDGQQLSNTLWLEQELAWTGLLIEPDPYNFQHLRHKHRKAWTSNSCISSRTFTKRSVYVAPTVRPGYSNPKWFVKGWSHELGVTLKTRVSPNDSPQSEEESSYFMAYCFPLHSYLLALNVTTIDVLSLDTQGSEMDIAKSIPWEDLDIRVLVLEIIDIDNFQTQFVEYMRGKGYVLVGNFLDYVFVKSGDSAHTRLTSHTDWYLEAKEVDRNVIWTHTCGKA